MRNSGQSSADLSDAFTVSADGDIAGEEGAKFEQLKIQYPSLFALFDVRRFRLAHGQLANF